MCRDKIRRERGPLTPIRRNPEAAEEEFDETAQYNEFSILKRVIHKLSSVG